MQSLENNPGLGKSDSVGKNVWGKGVSHPDRLHTSSGKPGLHGHAHSLACSSPACGRGHRRPGRKNSVAFCVPSGGDFHLNSRNCMSVFMPETLSAEETRFPLSQEFSSSHRPPQPRRPPPTFSRLEKIISLFDWFFKWDEKCKQSPLTVFSAAKWRCYVLEMIVKKDLFSTS